MYVPLCVRYAQKLHGPRARLKFFSGNSGSCILLSVFKFVIFFSKHTRAYMVLFMSILQFYSTLADNEYRI